MLPTVYRAFAGRRWIAVISTAGLSMAAQGGDDETIVPIVGAVPVFQFGNLLTLIGFALAIGLSLAVWRLFSRLQSEKQLVQAKEEEVERLQGKLQDTIDSVFEFVADQKVSTAKEMRG